MARATLKIEFSAGTNIEDAFAEAICIASILGCYTTFMFNDVRCLASPEGLTTNGTKAYYESLKMDATNRFAST
jgi:hypothetical protein